MDMEQPNNKETNTFKHHPLHAGIIGLGLLSGAVYLFNFKLDRLMPEFLYKTDIHLFLSLFLFLAILYFIGVYLIFNYLPQIGHSKSLIVIIIFFAIFFRAVLVPTDPTVLSTDMYRYIWDGRVQQNDINPYLYPPSSEKLRSLRDDEIYPHINRKESPTIYPAGAQLFFRISHILVGDRIYGFKGLMVFFDVMTLLVLLALLRAYGFEETRLFIYAWNPLVIFEIGYSGHLEGLTVLLMVLAFYLNAKNRKTPAVIALAFSSATKLYPALILPALLNRGERIKGVIVFAVSFLLLYLPYLTAGNKIGGFLPIYFKNPYESFNLGLKYLIMGLVPGLDYFFLSKFFMLFLMAAGFYFFFKEKQKEQSIRCAYFLAGLLLILMPAALHPWYVIMLIPFLAFFPSIAWLIFTCTVALSYIKYVSPMGIMPAWVLLLEYLPLFALLATSYIFKRYARQSWVSGFFTANRTEKYVEAQK
jgi:alpha-1,6-mannosyltransferase